jgi:poly(hydroxyalkanoate) depolymerase family esterase
MLNNGKFAVRATAWVAAIGVIGLLSIPRFAAAGNLVAVTEYENDSHNPNLGMQVYVPIGVAVKPAVLVAAHGCDGSGQQFFQDTEFASLADQYGFIVIYPTAVTGTGGDHCFEIETSSVMTHVSNGDAASVVAMVNHVLRADTYNGDSTRVFATGWSSGAMLTNVLLADYPDVFAAGAPFAGVPFNCMAGYPDGVRGNACSAGQVIKTAQEWGTFVRSAYPTYAGTRPRVQLWHGTSDSILNYANFGEELKQWTNVFSTALGKAVSQTSLDYLGFPPYTATRMTYGASGSPLVETISVSGAGHSLLATPGLAAVAIHFFGLDANPDAQPAITADTQPPSVPLDVQASNVTASGLTLTWSPSTDDTGVASYLVSKKIDSASAQVAPVTSVSGTTASITQLSAATSYLFWVQAQDKAGNASQVSASNILRVTTAAAPGGGGGGNTGGGGGGGGGTSGGGSSGGCTHGGTGSAGSGLALLALGVLALLRGRRRSPISA